MLPIFEHRASVISTVAENVVTIIQGGEKSLSVVKFLAGDTGCGKSSQVPLYLLQHCRSQKARALIIVTQPRRIAAISLAKRVAEEMGESIGHTVGFKIGNDAVADLGPHPSQIVFVTSGWLLQKMMYNMSFFDECTHLILDEMHERSVDSDLLYLLVKQQLHSKVIDSHSTRLLCMSATIDSEMFRDYFAVPGERIPPMLTVGVHRFPVDIIFIEDLKSHPIFSHCVAPTVLSSIGAFLFLFLPFQYLSTQCLTSHGVRKSMIGCSHWLLG